MVNSNTTGQGAHNDPDEELNRLLERTRIQAEQEAEAQFARETQQVLRATAGDGLQRIDDEARQIHQAIQNSRKQYDEAAAADFEKQIREATKNSMKEHHANIERQNEHLRRATEESLQAMRKSENDHFQSATQESLAGIQNNMRGIPTTAAGQNDDFQENPNYMNNVAALMADRRIQKALNEAPAAERDALKQTLLSEAKTHQDARDIRTRHGGNPDDEGPFQPSLLRRDKSDKKNDKARSSMRGGASNYRSQGD
jgi:hypothetical protein